MGLLTILKKMKQKEKQVRILILGLDNAGKTTICKKFSGEPIDTIEPTLGFNIQTLEYAGLQLNLWDIGGQKSIRSYWRNYFEQTDGIVWVVDSADRMRLELCKDELMKIIQQERLVGATLLIFANKQDVADALNPAEIAQTLGLESNAEQFSTTHWNIQGCSAVTGEGLLQGIDWLVQDISNRLFILG